MEDLDRGRDCRRKTWVPPEHGCLARTTRRTAPPAPDPPCGETPGGARRRRDAPAPVAPEAAPVGPLGGLRQHRLHLQQGPERLRLEQAAPGPAAEHGVVEIELVEHRPGSLAPAFGTGPPLGCELRPQLAIAPGRLEDPADDELRRRRPVPGVRLQAEGDVVGADLPPAVELRAEPERDRGAGGAALVPGTEAKVLALPHRLQVAEV